MKCPHCAESIHFEESDSSAYPVEAGSSKSTATGYAVAHGFCPNCDGLIVLLRHGTYVEAERSGYIEEDGDRDELIYPRSYARTVEAEVPGPYREAFLEAASVLGVSAKASAALSRRLLQTILREDLKVKASSLAAEIDELLARPGIPSYLGEAVDAIRNIGNFAAHPLKDTHSGEILDVEPGEAEWLLEVLESLFDFIFVQPVRLTARKKQLNAKLDSAGKPEMKSQ